jgi:hypothetical protein
MKEMRILEPKVSSAEQIALMKGIIAWSKEHGLGPGELMYIAGLAVFANGIEAGGIVITERAKTEGST